MTAIANLDDASPQVFECRAMNATDLTEFGLALRDHSMHLRSKYFFRGQGVAHPILVPKADRGKATNWRDVSAAESGIRRDVNRVLNMYRRRVHNVQGNLPKSDDWLEWMALIQHFGGPTPLLDTTESVMVAAYFAVAVATPHGAFLWCIRERHKSLMTQLETKLQLIRKLVPGVQTKRFDDAKTFEGARRLLADQIIASIHNGTGIGRRLIHYLRDPTDYMQLVSETELNGLESKRIREVDGIVAVRPYRLNPRLGAQNGWFATALNPAKSFMQQLVPDQASLTQLSRPIQLRALRKLAKLRSSIPEVLNVQPTCIRIWLTPRAVDELSAYLPMHNLTPFSLFPDFSGYTDALNSIQFDATVDPN